MLLSQFLFRMTPAYRKALTQAQKELSAKRSGDPNGPWGEYNPRPEAVSIVSAVVANVLVIPWKPGMKGEK